MLEAQADVREAPSPTHRDTDAQHGWVLDNFGINTRDPAHGPGGAVRERSAGAGQAVGGSAPADPSGDGHAGPDARHPSPETMPGHAAATGVPAAPALADAVSKITAALDGFKKRFTALHDPDKTFETKKAHANFVNAVTPVIYLLASTKAGDATETDALIAKAGTALAELERLFADVPRKAKAAADTAAGINRMPDADLHKASAADKAGLVEKLLAAGKPTGAVRDAQVKVYNAMQLDPGFVREDEDRGKQIAADLKGDAELEAARATWGTASKADKLKALRKVVAAQSKRLGITPPEVVAEQVPVRNGVVTAGEFSDEDGKLHVNMDPSSPVQDFAFALNVVLHENAHNYQAQLVQKLEAGKLTPGTPDYVQATMFRVNELEPGGYIPGETVAGLPAYQKQPLEDHAWTTGPATTAKILGVLQATGTPPEHSSPVRRHPT